MKTLVFALLLLTGPASFGESQPMKAVVGQTQTSCPEVASNTNREPASKPDPTNDRSHPHNRQLIMFILLSLFTLAYSIGPKLPKKKV